ncbi:MAG: DegT/DnrJ/EryC1/StrS family aminotransferase [Chloroflexota bacterium]|nr:DegT/DnrJ/EryC1/StrS family aminotransferase [Chloroflexota bacterium]
MSESIWRIPLADIDMGELEIEAVTEVLLSRWLTMGDKTREFEAAMARTLGVRHAIAVSNGTVALHLAYLALGLQPGDEIIMPSLTFVATANAAVYTGAVPVFAEIVGSHDLNIDPGDVARKVTPRTRAIAVVHYAGYPVDMDAIMQIARKYGLAVVEDAAHAPGALLNGQALGAIGDVGCFSFFSNKNLAVGEGGLVATNRDDLAEKMRLMRSHGMTTLTWDRYKGHASSYDVVALGFNYRMDEVRSALGLVQLGRLEAGNASRQALVARYHELLSGVSGVSVPYAGPLGKPSYHIMPVLLLPGISRPSVIGAMKGELIQTSIHYPPIHLFTYYRERYNLGPGLLPVTEEVAARELTLPLYPTMSLADVDQVVAALKLAIKQEEYVA